MTTDGKPVAVEGNIADIDTAAKFFTLEGRDGKVFLKVFWKLAHDAKMMKKKPGYYEAPVVEMEEHTGGLQEAVLIDLPWKERPADFPRSQRQQGGGNKGGGNWQPKKPRVTIAATVNLQNYENIKVEVEGSSADECTKILIDTLDGFARNPAYSTTREMIQGYMRRVLNVGVQ